MLLNRGFLKSQEKGNFRIDGSSHGVVCSCFCQRTSRPLSRSSHPTTQPQSSSRSTPNSEPQLTQTVAAAAADEPSPPRLAPVTHACSTVDSESQTVPTLTSSPYSAPTATQTRPLRLPPQYLPPVIKIALSALPQHVPSHRVRRRRSMLPRQLALWDDAPPLATLKRRHAHIETLNGEKTEVPLNSQDLPVGSLRASARAPKSQN
ncbi:hypothetical protein R3P38DRAFT_2762322 [Favolaschia claudopus]|uniref:Uncharacterized protein n=1 Tax=Favolaschia claudopus TaxID=2862362 RepID=A0AAW0DG44_9AGAR